MPVRVLIVDDHGVLRAAVRSLLQKAPDLEVVGEASDGQQALSLTETLAPDLVLLDISLPGADGIAVMKSIKARFPRVLVLVLTAHEDSGLLIEAIRAGAAGYVVKRAVESELIGAIAAVSRGDLYVHPAVTRGLLSDSVPGPAPHPDHEAILTPREIEVLRLIAQGHTNSQVGIILSLSVRTVESHRANIMDKLHLENRAELVRYARDYGLLDKK